MAIIVFSNSSITAVLHIQSKCSSGHVDFRQSSKSPFALRPRAARGLDKL